MTGTIRYAKTLDAAGEWVERPTYYLDGRVVTFDVFTEAFPDQLVLPGQVPGGHLPGCWPLPSEAAAVHPAQAREAADHAKKLGVPTEFNGLGQPVFTDRAHRKRFLKAHGMVDRSGGYGD
jgi:hypothetical protein